MSNFASTFTNSKYNTTGIIYKKLTNTLASGNFTDNIFLARKNIITKLSTLAK
ncbi:hypothetical protein D029_4811A, partial [Vibrio parahaemolyticus 970107]